MEHFAASDQYQSAALVARRLLAINPDNLPACRTMATLAEKAGKIEALSWRRKIIQLAPEPENQLALVRAAVRFGQPELAETILETLPQSARSSIEYHQAAGASALARQQMERAENEFAAALALAPQNPQLLLNLALLRLFSGERNIANDARATLEHLCADKTVRAAALRALAADAIAHHDRSLGAKWASELRSEKDATLADALLYLEATQESERFGPTLVKLENEAATSPATAAELITWLNRHGSAEVALQWSSSLPKKIAEAHPVPLAIAEAHSFTQDWNALRDFVAGKNWGENEALRLAVESHALQRLSPPDRPSMEAQSAWSAALKKAQAYPQQLVAIAQLAEGWGYREEAEEAWWAIANGNENPRLALSALQRAYKSQQDTRGLLRVAKRALEMNPNDLVAANNCASLGLLVSGDNTARRLAFKLHQEHPTVRAFTTTYAFALQTAGKSAEGLKVMESLREEELQRPAIAAYYVVMLVENGKLERARAYLSHAESASLLPEEQMLLREASRKLG